MGTFNSFRKAYGALKDSTKVGLAKVNSEYKNLDIAIVKATNHVEYPPKERHVRTTSIIRPRADVAFCINALAKRLSKTRSWIVAIKILIVIHRTLREGDPTFREEILNYASKGRIFQISNFKDDSSPLAWDCSAWVRTYAMFLEERLECFRVLKYDIETERLTKSTPAASKAHSKTRFVSSAELVEQLPALQQLLFRLFNCQPEGAAYSNTLVQYALALVLKESFKIYCAINDGIINLVDMFFDMPKHEAVRAFNMYKRAGQQAENLAEFYECCKGLDMARTFQFPTLRQPPPSFLSSMEEYIKEAPQTAASVQNKLAYEGRQQPPPYEAVVTEKHEEKVEQPKSLIDEEEDIKPQDKAQEPQPLISTDITDDLLGLNIEETNALALAIVQPEGTNSGSGGLSETGGSGWEIALVTAPTNNTTTNVVEHKMGGGFDKFLLDSLYENEAARRQLQMTNAGYGYGHNGMSMQNSYQHHHHFQDPFMMSSNVAQQDQMLFHQQQQQHQHQHQHQHQQQQQMMMVPYQLQSQSPYFQHPQYYPQQQMPPQMGMGAPNPFGDPFSNNLQPCPPTKGNYALL